MEKHTKERRFKAALKLIADGKYDDRAGDPKQWAGMIAYAALGGRLSDDLGRLDDVSDL